MANSRFQIELKYSVPTGIWVDYMEYTTLEEYINSLNLTVSSKDGISDYRIEDGIACCNMGTTILNIIIPICIIKYFRAQTLIKILK